VASPAKPPGTIPPTSTTCPIATDKPTSSPSTNTGLKNVCSGCAGAEFGDDWDRWTGQTYYEWPPATVRASELNHYASKGMNVVRLPISWERLQHTLCGPNTTRRSND
jgi:aryl-phospho-beta-D-glucosidase BglC (GH1 family)